MKAPITLANPMPNALEHYMQELCQTLQRVGVPTKIDANIPTVEGVSWAGRLRYLAYRASKTKPPKSPLYLQTWPATGLVEPLLLARAPGNKAVVLHDPVPLRHQFGFGPISRALARRFNSDNVTIISHTSDASDVSVRLFPRAKHLQAPHPILTHQQHTEKDQAIILVAGQYKPARDLGLLAKLGPALRKAGYSPRIVGRGWPAGLPGWAIESRYLTESELTSELARATALILPYTQYFQSGIMLRALEQGTVTISRRTSFAEQILGSGAPLIVDSPNEPESWLHSVAQSANPIHDVGLQFRDYQQSVDASWREALDALLQP